MTTFTDVFGNKTLPPSEYKYADYPISSNLALAWPYNNQGSNIAAKLMTVNASVGSLTVSLPPANQVSTGEDLLIINTGSNQIGILDSVGNSLATIAAGVAKYFYLKDNSTAAGTWSVITYGAGTAASDALLLAGYGLKASGGTLITTASVTEKTTNYTVQTTDRAGVITYTSGTTTVSLSSSATYGNDFYFLLKNAGSGTVTVTPTVPELIDGESSLALAPGESCIIACSGAAFYTVGYGRSVQFAFTKLVKDVSGGTAFTLSSQEASNKIIEFIGTPTGNVTVTIPSVVSIYYVQAALSTSNTVSLKTSTGTSLAIANNTLVIVYCDGVNTQLAQSAVATTNLSIIDGTVTNPAIFFSTNTNTGIYKAGTNQLGIAVGGVNGATFSTTSASFPGIDNTPIGSTTPSSGKFNALYTTLLTGLLKGNGASAVTAATAGTDYAKPDTSSTWTATQTFNNSAIRLLGSSTGYSTFASANAGASNYTITFPAANTSLQISAYSHTLSGPTAARTYTLPDANATLLSTNALVTVAQGGTGVGTLTGIVKGNGTSAFSAATVGTDYVAPATNTNFTASQRGSFTTLTDAATIAVNIDGTNFYRCLLGGNRTLGEPTSSVASPEGQSGSFTMYQDGTGSRTLAYAWCYDFAAGTAPTLSTGKYSKDILAYQIDYFRSSTVTITIATPGVVTWNSHGLQGGQKVQLTTTGALPTGLAVNTTYWVIPVDANTFRLATSFANAQAGTAITTSGTQSGAHTMRAISISISVLGDAR